MTSARPKPEVGPGRGSDGTIDPAEPLGLAGKKKQGCGGALSLVYVGEAPRNESCEQGLLVKEAHARDLAAVSKGSIGHAFTMPPYSD